MDQLIAAAVIVDSNRRDARETDAAFRVSPTFCHCFCFGRDYGRSVSARVRAKPERAIIYYITLKSKKINKRRGNRSEQQQRQVFEGPWRGDKSRVCIIP